jgi:hypothetical protein
MATTTEGQARILARRHAVTGVPAFTRDAAGEAALASALGHPGPATMQNAPHRWRWLSAYHEAYDRAAKWAAGDPGAVVSPGEARQWARWRDEARIEDLCTQRDEGNDYGPAEARELAALTGEPLRLPGAGSHDRLPLGGDGTYTEDDCGNWYQVTNPPRY